MGFPVLTPAGPLKRLKAARPMMFATMMAITAVAGGMAPTMPAFASEAGFAADGTITQGQNGVSTFQLENGMRAVVIEDHRAPVVTHMVWYRAGAADELPGKSGIAHFLEHLMFKGTDEIADGEFSKIIAANGGKDNAFTSYDYTGYFQRIASDRLDLVMKMEADRMVDLRLSDEVVAPERSVILEERSLRVDRNPGAIMNEQMEAAMYTNSPYGIPLIGWRDEMEQLDREDALQFYHRHYTPSNAILVVAGDVTPEHVKELAEKYYGVIKSRELAPRWRAKEPKPRAPRRVDYADPRVQQPYMVRAYLAPSRRAGQDRAAALSVLSEVLGGGINSRLTQSLVLDQKIALQAGAYYRASQRDMTELVIYAVPAPNVALTDLEHAVDAEIAKFLASDGPTEEELARIKNTSRASEVFALDDQQGRAQRYGAGLAADLTLAQIESWPEDIQQVTAPEVMDAAASVLKIERSVTGRLMNNYDQGRPPSAANDNQPQGEEK